jgi:transcriptional regulator with XRE-family HTH domain
MSTDFSRILSLLRREKHISQRAAAAELGISQALLSHYENGIREPGLAFVVKACDFYGVSADYLLGRTMSKDGAIIYTEELYDESQSKDNSLRGNIAAQLNKKLLVNAVSLIYSLLGRLGNRELILYVSNYLSCGVYTVFRDIYSVNQANLKGFFALDDPAYSSGAVSANMQRAKCDLELELLHMAQDKEQTDTLSGLTPETIKKEYPALYQSLLQILHNTNGRVSKMLAVKSTDK